MQTPTGGSDINWVFGYFGDFLRCEVADTYMFFLFKCCGRVIYLVYIFLGSSIFLSICLIKCVYFVIRRLYWKFFMIDFG